MTDRYAVIGNPIHQSKSPLIHGMFAQATGQDMQYAAIEGLLDGFAGAVDAFRAAGGRGMNITAPFKLDAFAYATERSERAQLAGAANAMKFDGERVLAENFDGVGLVRDVVHNLNCPLKGKRVLLLGAGGAARGAMLPLLGESPAQLVIANRTRATADALVQHFAGQGGLLSACEFADLDGPFDLVVNATSASLSAAMPPLPATVFTSATLALDMMYGKEPTVFMDFASAHGATARDGLGMLVEQAAEAFAIWRGVRPETAMVLEQMRSSL